MIVDCAVYHHGVREVPPEDLSDALAAARTHGDSFVWVGLKDPNMEELQHVASEFRLHPLAIEDAVHAHQRPKLEDYDGSLFLVLKTVRYVEDTQQVELGDVMLFVGDAFVVTVRHGEGGGLAEVRKRLEDDRDVLDCGPSAVVYAVCDHVVDQYTKISAEVEEDIEEVEERVFSPLRTNDASRIYNLKREVIEFRRAVLPLVEPMRKLSSGTVPMVHERMRPFFRDVADHTVRAAEQIDGFDDLLGSVLSANLAQVGVQQNEDMRRISAWVAIAAVPTALAGIYGMNFDHMPELGWTFGYPLVLGVMALACVLLYRGFRRSGWL
ncbi:MAG: magnesium transporter [Actinomycetota bacterium]|nr:magnesium transporter [Actinomycetota bacterium]